MKLPAVPAAVFAALVIGAALAPQAGSQTLPTVRFVLDWKFEGQQAQYTTPAEDGTFRRLGVNVQVDRGAGSGDTIAKVASGAYDIGLADTYAMVRFNAATPSNQLISVAMVHDASSVGVVALRAKGISTPADLQGKKIYAPTSDAGRQLFPLFASMTHIDNNLIQWNTVTSDLRDAMLARREADAVTCNTVTTVLNLQAAGVAESDLQIFYYNRFGIPLYGSSIVTTRAFAEKNPEAIRNVVRGLVHGLNVMIKDQDAAMATLKKRDPLLNDTIEKARMRRTMRDALVTPNVIQNGFSSVDKARLELTLQQTAGAFGITAPSADDVYTDKYLPPAEERKILPWQP